MSSYAFGGYDKTTGYTSDYAYVGGIGLPGGRACANGSAHAMLTRLYGYAGGRGAARTCVLSLGSAATDGFGIAASGGTPITGWQACSNWLVNGGSATFTVNCDSSFQFGRASSGGTVYDSYGSTWTGVLGGGVEYVLPPNAPSGLTAVPNATTPGAVDLAWTAPTDDGGTGITGYRIHYSEYADFHVASATDTVGLGRTATIIGLDPGKTYYFIVAAKNAVTAAAGTYSIFSGYASCLVRSGVKVWNGSVWVPASARVWNGSAWVPVVIKAWNGSAWVDAK